MVKQRLFLDCQCVISQDCFMFGVIFSWEAGVGWGAAAVKGPEGRLAAFAVVLHWGCKIVN